jgi:hypothetical protein
MVKIIRKKTVKIFIFFMVYVLLSVNVFPAIALATNKTIPAGTFILLRTTTTLTPDKFKVGDRVDLTVLSDVIVEGKVLVKAGTIAYGEISQSEEPGLFGKPGKLAVTLKSVSAADGTMVPISGNKVVEGKDKSTQSILLFLFLCVLFVFDKGGDAVIPAGTQLEGLVLSPIVVNVEFL